MASVHQYTVMLVRFLCPDLYCTVGNIISPEPVPVWVAYVLSCTHACSSLKGPGRKKGEFPIHRGLDLLVPCPESVHVVKLSYTEKCCWVAASLSQPRIR
jgi:hypothetical protein